MGRDIDEVIERVKQRVPDANVWQLRVSHPGVDDDGLWFFTVPDARSSLHRPKSIQIESLHGMCPFIVEHDDMRSSAEAEVAATVGEAVEKVVAYLGRVRAGTVPNALEMAMRVLRENAGTPYGIFGVVGSSGYFPPRPFLNEFLARGHDPCDQDGRMGRWTPVALSSAEYAAVTQWWASEHPGAVEDNLGAQCWDDWVQTVLDR